MPFKISPRITGILCLVVFAGFLFYIYGCIVTGALVVGKPYHYSIVICDQNPVAFRALISFYLLVDFIPLIFAVLQISEKKKTQ